MIDMMTDKLIDVYPYSVTRGQVRFLIFRRSAEVVYAGQWRMVGGKVREGESRADAALRELGEETGCRPDQFWTVPSVNQFYDAATDTIHHIAVFAACLDIESSVHLNHEHDCYLWIPLQDVKKFIKWPEQVRLISLIHDILATDGILPQWQISQSQ
jgi:dihydroneopterin triphosphate diphosphatase